MTTHDITTIALRHCTKGTFTASPEMLDRALKATAFRSLPELRREVAGHCGYDERDWDTAMEDLTWVEVCIAWLDSGNHPF